MKTKKEMSSTALKKQVSDSLVEILNKLLLVKKPLDEAEIKTFTELKVNVQLIDENMKNRYFSIMKDTEKTQEYIINFNLICVMIKKINNYLLECHKCEKLVEKINPDNGPSFEDILDAAKAFDKLQSSKNNFYYYFDKIYTRSRNYSTEEFINHAFASFINNKFNSNFRANFMKYYFIQVDELTARYKQVLMNNDQIINMAYNNLRADGLIILLQHLDKYKLDVSLVLNEFIHSHNNDLFYLTGFSQGCKIKIVLSYVNDYLQQADNISKQNALELLYNITNEIENSHEYIVGDYAPVTEYYEIEKDILPYYCKAVAIKILLSADPSTVRIDRSVNKMVLVKLLVAVLGDNDFKKYVNKDDVLKYIITQQSQIDKIVKSVIDGIMNSAMQNAKKIELLNKFSDKFPATDPNKRNYILTYMAQNYPEIRLTSNFLDIFENVKKSCAALESRMQKPEAITNAELVSKMKKIIADLDLLKNNKFVPTAESDKQYFSTAMTLAK